MAAAAFLFTMACALLLTAKTSVATANGSVQLSKVAAMFVFGDSLIDPGNNNNLLTLAKSNYPPNGIDFAEGVTGRFCNGATLVDHLCDLLGLPLLPPFNGPSATGKKSLTHGVNYASAGGGILNDTGGLSGQIYSMDSQIQNFRTTLGELQNEIGHVQTEKLITNSIFFVNIGSNDYLNNYLLPFSNKPDHYTLDEYSILLVEQHVRQLKNLYNLGARRLLLVGLPPLGCTPNQIGSIGGDPNACVDHVNAMILQFNDGVQATLLDTSSNFSGAHLLYWDSYAPSMEVIMQPLVYGFKYSHVACCGVGRSKGQMLCIPQFLCDDRLDYVFWDPYHPSDATNAILAKRLYQWLLDNKFLE